MLYAWSHVEAKKNININGGSIILSKKRLCCGLLCKVGVLDPFFGDLNYS